MVDSSASNEHFAVSKRATSAVTLRTVNGKVTAVDAGRHLSDSMSVDETNEDELSFPCTSSLLLSSSASSSSRSSSVTLSEDEIRAMTVRHFGLQLLPLS